MRRAEVLIAVFLACLAANSLSARAQAPGQPGPDYQSPPPEAGPGGAEPEPEGLPPMPEESPADAAPPIQPAPPPRSSPFGLFRPPRPPPPAPRAAPAAADPNDWWSHGESSPPTARDPLFGRRASREELARAPKISSNADALLYRLWGLQPLQIQHVRQGELVLEVWVRPQKTVRQALIRITVRDDGRGFVQARAGLGCCSPEVGRRVDIDRELPAGYVALFTKLGADLAWSQAENVVVDYGGGAVDALCVGGFSYDLVLVQTGRAVHLRRACAGAELGSAADILSAAIGAALGKDARFDVLFPKGADFSEDKRAYDELIRTGGRLKPRADG